MPKSASPWRSFLSSSTLISGLVSAVVFSIWYRWSASFLLVLLLYLHEAGHILMARMRKVPVRRAPTFLPGLGAFVATSPTTNFWDEVWIVLGGPVIGGLAGLAATWIGFYTNYYPLAIMGSFSVFLNMANMAPLLPLDGGRLAALTGWLGFVFTVLAGIGVLRFTGDMFLSLLALYAMLQAWQTVRRRSDPRIGTGARLGITGLHLLAIGVLLVLFAFAGGPGVAWNMLVRRPYSPLWDNLYWVVLGLYFVSQYAVNYAMRPQMSARQRYLTLALGGWPQYLLTDPWMVPALACIAMEAYGQPALAPLQRLTRSLAGKGQETAGTIAGFGYDLLRRQGRADDAREWLAAVLSPMPESDVVVAAIMQLLRLGYRQKAGEVAADAIAEGFDPAGLDPALVNMLAWALAGANAPEAALTLARAAVTAQPDSFDCLDTLGQVLLINHDPADAETALRRSLELRNRPGTRVALAASLANQGRYTEAVLEAERALQEQQGPWPGDEPGAEQIEAWIREWRFMSQPDEEEIPPASDET